MRTLVAVPFADTKAADLSLARGLHPLPALAERDVPVPGGRLLLRVLGASHQVLAEFGASRWSETVACLPDRDRALPASDEGVADALRVRFTARCERLTPAELSSRVAALRERCVDDDGALLAVFPGSPDAVTALIARGEQHGGARWDTWHVYPQTGEVVTTRSLLTIECREVGMHPGLGVR